MFEELVGKNVSVNMLFSSYCGEGGSAPASYNGTVLSVKDGFIKLRVSSYNITYDGSTGAFVGYSLLSTALVAKKTDADNEMYFNINSISYIKVNN